MKYVMKFGGSTLEDIEKVADIVKRYYDEGNEVAIVVSALPGITDTLETYAKRISESGDLTLIKELIDYLSRKHKQLVTIEEEKVVNSLDKDLANLEKALVGIAHLGELTERSLDYISSFGERLIAPVISNIISSKGIKSSWLTGGEAGIVTDKRCRSASPLPETDEIVAKRVAPMLKNGIPVITGYIGETIDGRTTTLGKGGSDYTASIIGAAIDADEILLWKDSEGVMTADPKIVPEAKPIPSLSYAESMELSFFGAEILHPKTLDSLIAKNKEIPVRVKSIVNPERPGTVIERDSKPIKDVIKSISLVKDVALIHISGSNLVGTPKAVAGLFEVLAKEVINIVMISQGSSERNISMVIDASHLRNAYEALRRSFGVDTITYKDDVCAMAVVGADMAGKPGVAGRVFSSLGRNKINIIMISQGSSEHNISFVVSEDDAHKAVRIIHDEFFGR